MKGLCGRNGRVGRQVGEVLNNKVEKCAKRGEGADDDMVSMVRGEGVEWKGDEERNTGRGKRSFD